MCSECGGVNPLDSWFCCECGSVVDGYRSREDAAFRFTVSNCDELEDTIRSLKELEHTAELTEMQRRQVLICQKCEKSNLLENRSCDECGSVLDGEQCTIPETNFVRVALLTHISWLQGVMESSLKEAHVLSRKRDEPQVRACSQCGDMNPEATVFCGECGADIEIIRGNRL